ncbi:M15 family metallopeptidase [Dyadobacter bucti]|uniref:M15 family metallopeptidase n=1 Tax=Dyadobacter bucti TaxID=2572203 RepID=UPI00110805D3|nr:M15 family metallopeptidase [Dyadobacter bucti]
MKTQKQLIEKFGNPAVDNITFERKWMTLWHVPEAIGDHIPAIPGKIYLNNLIKERLETTLFALIEADLHSEIKTFDGCFNIRKKRGLETLSLHAFGIAVDLNAAWNQLGKPSTWSNDFIEVWRRNGWECGADWKGRIDAMHFQWDNF